MFYRIYYPNTRLLYQYNLNCTYIAIFVIQFMTSNFKNSVITVLRKANVTTKKVLLRVAVIEFLLMEFRIEYHHLTWRTCCTN